MLSKKVDQANKVKDELDKDTIVRKTLVNWILHPVGPLKIKIFKLNWII